MKMIYLSTVKDKGDSISYFESKVLRPGLDVNNERRLQFRLMVMDMWNITANMRNSIFHLFLLHSWFFYLSYVLNSSCWCLCLVYKCRQNNANRFKGRGEELNGCCSVDPFVQNTKVSKTEKPVDRRNVLPILQLILLHCPKKHMEMFDAAIKDHYLFK